MIQRIQVILQDPARVQHVRQGLAAIGFPNVAIRVFQEAQTNFHNFFAYRDDDVDNWPVLTPNQMDQYVAEIWQRAGPCIVRLEIFDRVGQMEERTEEDWDAWDAAQPKADA